MRARNMFLEQTHPELGTITMPNLPFHFSDCVSPTPSVAPRIGQHNREIAQSLGYAEHEVDAMESAGVLHSDGKAN